METIYSWQGSPASTAKIAMSSYDKLAPESLPMLEWLGIKPSKSL
jgi:hypothetical protein